MPIQSLPTRKIGTTSITALGYGAMGIGNHAYGYCGDDEERFKILDRLFALGCTNWDTAPVYGDSEVLLGKWFTRTGKRDEIFLATKFGMDRSVPGLSTLRGDAEFLRQDVAQSLEQLQTDHIDLLYQHRLDPKTPIEITVRAMKELVDQGKVKYLGLSEASPNTIRRAHKIHPISAIQVEYSPWELTIEKPGGVLEVARELGITVFGYSPAGRGIVSGRWRSWDDLPENDFRRLIPRYAAKNWPQINKLVDSIQELGKRYNATPAQVAIAWLLKQGDDVVPIPGSKQIKYIEENLSALKIELTDADLAELRKLANAVHEVLNEDARYPGPVTNST